MLYYFNFSFQRFIYFSFLHLICLIQLKLSDLATLLLILADLTLVIYYLIVSNVSTQFSIVLFLRFLMFIFLISGSFLVFDIFSLVFFFNINLFQLQAAQKHVVFFQQRKSQSFWMKCLCSARRRHKSYRSFLLVQ